MRPIERGDPPRVYTNYRDAFGDLSAQLGTYCSYCERRIASGLAIEHIVPKSRRPDLETEWTNFLLSCANCNLTKSDKPVNTKDFLWPYVDNTFLAFVYTEGGLVQLAQDLSTAQREKAQALLDLVGLQRHPALGRANLSRTDHRWQQRDQAWKVAEICKENFTVLARSDEAKELVLKVAQSEGFFSVWMTVFEDDPEMKVALIKLFPGTAPSCFDLDGKALNRPDGVI